MNRRSTNLRGLLIAGSLSYLAACSEDISSQAGSEFNPDNIGNNTSTPSVIANTFNQQALLENLVDNIITPTYQDFLTQAQAQQETINTYCGLEQNHNDGDDRQAIETALSDSQSQWLTTTNQWQLAEVMQIGPLTTNSSTLRNNIYSWPVISHCGIDQDILFFQSGFINTTPYEITQRTSTRRGLDAAHYLLFNPSLEHSCTTQRDILDTWPTLSDQQRRVARCEFAVEVATDITASAQSLNDQWETFSQTLKNAGELNNDFDDVHDGVNAVTDALFYIDGIVKDKKIGTPLGLFTNNCGGVGSICIDDVESALSDQSISHLIQNLTAFQKLFTGQGIDETNTVGFDDYLTDVNDQSTSDNIIASTQKAIDDLTAYQVSLSQRLTTDATAVEATHSNVKDITDQMKADFINSLALSLPSAAAGDND